MKSISEINGILKSWGNLGFKSTPEARDFIVANKEWKTLVKMKLGDTSDVDKWRLREIDKREYEWVRRIV